MAEESVPESSELQTYFRIRGASELTDEDLFAIDTRPITERTGWDNVIQYMKSNWSTQRPPKELTLVIGVVDQIFRSMPEAIAAAAVVDRVARFFKHRSKDGGQVGTIDFKLDVTVQVVTGVSLSDEIGPAAVVHTVTQLVDVLRSGSRSSTVTPRAPAAVANNDCEPHRGNIAGDAGGQP